jgi:hypothetical protein
VAIPGESWPTWAKTFVVERLEIDKDKEDGQKEARVADAVHHKGFRGGLRSGDFVVVVADQ